MFLNKHYFGLFEDLITVSGASRKRKKIREIADVQNVNYSECELVEDTFMTLLDVMDDGSFIIVYVGNENADFELELTWLRDHEGPYNLGDEEFHLAFRTDDIDAAHALHEEMGCICFENKAMGIYFIKDPDGYWLEIVPER